MIKKAYEAYETKPKEAAGSPVKPDQPQTPRTPTTTTVIENKCPLCGSKNVIRTEIPGNDKSVVLIHCQEGNCLYPAKYVNGKLV